MKVLEAADRRDAIHDEGGYALLARIHRSAGRTVEAEAAERHARELDGR